MPLKTGYSKTTVAHNIAELEKAGHPRSVALKVAFNHARRSFFTRHPKGALPVDIAFPKTARLAAQYTSSGSPIFRTKNPVDELDIPDEEMAEIRHVVQKDFNGKGQSVRKAAALYTDFTGHSDPRLTKLKIPSYPKVILEVGKVDGILYTTVRDGVTEKYIHKFKSKARPLLAASPDGKQLLMIGGSFTFTERGIVDD